MLTTERGWNRNGAEGFVRSGVWRMRMRGRTGTSLNCVQRTTVQESSTLYCTYPVRTFLCMSVHHNNKQHNGGLQWFCLKCQYGSLLRLRLCRSLTDQRERRSFAVKPPTIWEGISKVLCRLRPFDLIFTELGLIRSLPDRQLISMFTANIT